MAEKMCPHCRTELAAGRVDDLHIDVCFSCHGTWFDRGELRRAKDVALPDGDWLDFDIWSHGDRFTINAGPVNCPCCGRRLCRVQYGDTHVEIDVCPTCEGVWLDEAELSKIVEVLNREINSKSFSEYLRAAFAEAVEIVSGDEPVASEWKDFKHVVALMYRRLFVEHPHLTEAMNTVQQSFSFLR